MDKYSALDAKIIGAIGGGRRGFGEVCAAARDEAKTLESSPGEKAEGWRIVDRRLQALRKAGKIRYARNSGWVLV